jgi:hypothetical protein
LTREYRQYLRHQPETDFMQLTASGCPDALNLFPIRAFDGFRE